MNITYTQNGDYLIPNIIVRKTKPLGHYGRLRKAYLEMHRPILFNELVLSDKLFEHCAEIDEAAQNNVNQTGNQILQDDYENAGDMSRESAYHTSLPSY